jgi:hypothetical protein
MKILLFSTLLLSLVACGGKSSGGGANSGMTTDPTINPVRPDVNKSLNAGISCDLKTEAGDIPVFVVVTEWSASIHERNGRKFVNKKLQLEDHEVPAIDVQKKGPRVVRAEMKVRENLPEITRNNRPLLAIEYDLEISGKSGTYKRTLDFARRHKLDPRANNDVQLYRLSNCEQETLELGLN